MSKYSSLQILICILAFIACKNTPDIIDKTASTIPKSITYQNLNITTGTFDTTVFVRLYPDSNNIYFDSATTSFFGGTPFNVKFNKSLFASKKYLIAQIGESFDSNFVSLLKFDNQNRIIQVHDAFNLVTDLPSTSLGTSGYYNTIEYNSNSTSTMISNLSRIYDPFVGLQSNGSFNFDITHISNDSIKVVSGRNTDQTFYDRTFKYTTIFENKKNNCNLALLSGIMYSLSSGSYNEQFTTMFINFIKQIPIPKLNTKLPAHIYLTEEYGISVNRRLADFTYEFDNLNRVTKATIINYQYEPSGNISTNRILINY